mmetsp:Transcript_43767/g.102135  ORF Transcript_43767/g.102135 Transcript_43767/m.102135 type:complete len:527 (+) Transcript_43767:71-1651(+)
MDDEPMPKQIEEVLQRQHDELLARMDVWLERFNSLLMRPMVIPAVDAVYPSSPTPDALVERPRRRSMRVPSSPPHEPSMSSNAALRRTRSYEIAKEQGDRVESIKRIQSTVEGHDRPSRLRLCLQAVQRRAQVVASSIVFNVFFAFVIVSNSIFLGMQLEWSALRVDRFVEPGFVAAHLVYAILFTVEMFIRITAAGPRQYFVGAGWAWNWLDVLVVVPGWVELVIDVLEETAAAEGASSSNFRIIRVFKVTRLLQVVRSLRIVKFIGALRALVLSVVDTTRQLVWALLLLLLVIYSFGILFTDAVLDYLFSHETNDERLEQYFGSVYLSCVTLFRAILGGTDWDIAADALVPVGMAWVQLFHGYIAFCGFAVLNVMTGVFVNSAIKTRERDHETLMQNGQRLKDLVAKLWGKIDTTGLGQITISEFEELFEDEAMKAFFAAIEINAVDAWTLFDSLDVDGDHTISVEEFTERCLQLHGPARSVDLYALKKQMKNLEGSQRQISDYTARILKAVAMQLDPRDSFSC